jgi:hypothetical protein
MQIEKLREALLHVQLPMGRNKVLMLSQEGASAILDAILPIISEPALSGQLPSKEEPQFAVVKQLIGDSQFLVRGHFESIGPEPSEVEFVVEKVIADAESLARLRSTGGR